MRERDYDILSGTGIKPQEWQNAVKRTGLPGLGDDYRNKAAVDPNACEMQVNRMRPQDEDCIDPLDPGPKSDGYAGQPATSPSYSLRLQRARNGGWALFTNYDDLISVFHSMDALCIWLRATQK